MGWSTRFLVTLFKCRMCLTRKTSFLGPKQNVLISRRRRTVRRRSDGCVTILGQYSTNHMTSKTYGKVLVAKRITLLQCSHEGTPHHALQIGWGKGANDRGHRELEFLFSLMFL